MKNKEDHIHLKEVLAETITLLCKNGLHFKEEFSVEALIGVTLDKEDIVLVNIKEMFKLPVSDEIEDEYHCNIESQNSINSESNNSETQNMLNEESTTKSFDAGSPQTTNKTSNSYTDNSTHQEENTATEKGNNSWSGLNLEHKSGNVDISNNIKSGPNTSTMSQGLCKIDNLAEKPIEVKEEKDDDIMIIKEENFSYPCMAANKYRSFPGNFSFPPHVSRNSCISSGSFPGYIHGGPLSYPFPITPQDNQYQLPEGYVSNSQKAKVSSNNSQPYGRQHSSGRGNNINIRTFHCEPCGKSYSNAHGLWRHRQVEHLRCSGAVCSQCGKSFTRKDHMLRHLRSEHLKIGSVLCPYCSKVFYRKDKLTLHLNRCPMAPKVPNIPSTNSISTVNSSPNPVTNVNTPQVGNYTNLLSSSFYQSLDCHHSEYPELQVKSAFLHNNQNRPIFPALTPDFSAANSLNSTSLTSADQNVLSHGNLQENRNILLTGNNMKQNDNLSLNTNQHASNNC